MIRFDGQVYYCDVDKTLCFDPKEVEHGTAEIRIINCFGRQIPVIAHKPMLTFLQYMYNRGFTILVHSRSGAEWAESVCICLGISHMVAAVLAKPLYYGDDQPVETWFGERIYKTVEGE